MTVLRGAVVVDGTGNRRRRADVVVEGDTIAAVQAAGTAPGPGVDLDGLVLAPGFIDVHTHYDAQLLWDPDLVPSSWHGVTTVVVGNCGFGIAPTRPADRARIMRTLANVEGMSIDALDLGIDWAFESFGDYLDVVERRPKRLNVAAFIGHTPVRTYVLGDAATERPATDDEIRRVREIVGAGLDAGAIGFATSKSPVHFGDGGLPVPSQLATADEIRSIAEALRDRGRGVVQVTRGADFFIPEAAALSSHIGRPVVWTSLFANSAWGRGSELVSRQAALPGEVWPQTSCRPLTMEVQLADPYPFGNMASFKPIISADGDDRAALYADPAWRARARPEVLANWGERWNAISVAESDVHRSLIGADLASLGVARGVHPFDLLCDLSLAEDLQTRFTMVLANDDEAELGLLLADPRVLLGLSDAGAHASQLCDACFSTYLLEHWVRETGVLGLETAIWRLTGHPATVFRIPGRGRIAPGWAADLVAFDPDTVGVAGVERVHDLPAGADRLLARSRGIHRVWVAGRLTWDEDALTDARPGTLVRDGGR